MKKKYDSTNWTKKNVTVSMDKSIAHEMTALAVACSMPLSKLYQQAAYRFLKEARNGDNIVFTMLNPKSDEDTNNFINNEND